jgi:hypothetical protein
MTNISQNSTLSISLAKCANGKYRIGSGACIYKTKAAAERAYKAYLAKKHDKRK